MGHYTCTIRAYARAGGCKSIGRDERDKEKTKPNQTNHAKPKLNQMNVDRNWTRLDFGKIFIYSDLSIIIKDLKGSVPSTRHLRRHIYSTR